MKYQAPKKQRIFNTFMGMTNFNGYWWSPKYHIWFTLDDPNPLLRKNDYSSHCPCNSIRAFRRRLKKAPIGVEFILVSRYVGYNVYAYRTK